MSATETGGDFVVVWREEGEHGRAWTITDHDGKTIRRNLDSVRRSVYAVVTDPAELEEALSRGDGKRFAAPADVVAQVLGWDL